MLPACANMACLWLIDIKQQENTVMTEATPAATEAPESAAEDTVK